MIINNLQSDYNKLAYKEQITLSEVSKNIGVAQPNLSRAMARNVLSPMLIRAAEELGYDIEIKFVKRNA